MTAPISPEIYQSLLNERFSIHAAEGEFRATLSTVKILIDDEEQFCFSVLFLPEGQVLPQGTYRMHHPRIGEFTLFLVPIQQRRTLPIYYEAGFSLLKGEMQQTGD